MAYKKGKNGGKHKMDSGYMGMISADHNAHANLPQEVIQKNYPRCSYVDNYYLDDTIKGVDENIKDSVKKLKNNQSDSMY